ncbi:MAG: hypothetical protein ABI716_01945 [Candidatus Saccharibacteria bacterium]
MVETARLAPKTETITLPSVEVIKQAEVARKREVADIALKGLVERPSLDKARAMADIQNPIELASIDFKKASEAAAGKVFQNESDGPSAFVANYADISDYGVDQLAGMSAKLHESGRAAVEQVGDDYDKKTTIEQARMAESDIDRGYAMDYASAQSERQASQAEHRAADLSLRAAISRADPNLYSQAEGRKQDMYAGWAQKNAQEWRIKADEEALDAGVEYDQATTEK